MIGTKLSDRYEIASELGRGGMGVVYQAHDPLLNRDVAIKLTQQTLLSPEARSRFRAEAQTLARLDHPSIVPIFDIGEHEGALFFVMPVLKGQSLRHKMREQNLTLGNIIEGAIQVASALDYSHGLGVLHRDIKPENLMVSEEETGDLRFRVMDFGLARDTALSRFTKSGIMVGTVGYMSPEQVMGKASDGRTDIYSLGTVLYECLTGDIPFSGEMQSVLYRIVHEIPQHLQSSGLVDHELESIVLKCLEKDPALRPQKAADLVQMLRQYHSKNRENEHMRTVVLSRADLVARPALAPFVGREKEMKELQMQLNAAKAGECHLVVISGEAGVGKTRLLDELEALGRAQSLKILHGRFMEKDGAFPYHGFCELIQDFFRQKESGSSSGGLPDLSDLSADLISLFPMLSEVGEIRDSASAVFSPAAAPRTMENRNQIFELLARTITRLAAGKPIMLYLEDLHGAEVSVEALQYIVRRLGPTPTFIAGTYRPAEVEKGSALTKMLENLQGDPRFTPIPLGPLSPSEHKQLLSTVLGGQEIQEKLAKQIYESSEGNPFFAKELIRSLMDSGSMAQESTGAWALSGRAEIAADSLPATIQQAVEKRIADLPDDLIQVLSVAAVMGKSFGFDDLESLAGDESDLEKAVDRLVQLGIIEEERRSRSDVLNFTSGVMREVLYSKLTRRKRRGLHRRFAELLEKNHTGRLERVYPQLVYHYAEADEPEKAVEFGLLHARKSLESWSPEEVIRSAGIALEFLDEEWEGEPTLEGEAKLLLAAGHEMAGDMSAALRDVESAIQVFERLNQPQKVVESLLTAATMAWHARRTDETSRWVERGMQAARAAEDDASLAGFLSLAATLANLRSDYAKAAVYLKEGERLRASGAPESTEAVPTGGTLVVGNTTDIETIDPAGTTYDGEVEISSCVFETLISTDAEGRLVPKLCREWTVADGGKTFRFTLRDDVTFHDGTPLTAQEVKRGFEQSIRIRGDRVRASMSAISRVEAFRAGEADQVEGIVAAGPHELEIRLDHPLPIYPALLTENHTAVARAGSGEGARTVGTGPFRFESEDKAKDRLVLAANKDHWKTPPRVDHLEFRGGYSSATMAAALRSGEVDVARNLGAADLDRLLREAPFRGRLMEMPAKHTFFAMFNALTGPLARDAAVRRALAGVPRVRDLVWNTLGRFVEPAAGLIPPGISAHDPGRRREPMSMEAAKELLASAGLPEPLRLCVGVLPGSQERYGDFLKGLFAPWRELGFEIEFTKGAELYQEVSRKPEGVDVLLIGWMADHGDPDAFTHTLFHSRTGNFCNFYSSEASDRILEAAREESRPEERLRLYRDFENLLEEEAAVLPLFHQSIYRLPGPRVRNLRMKNSPPYSNYEEVGKAGEAPETAATVTLSGGTLRVPVPRGVTRAANPAEVRLVSDAETLACVFEPLTRVGEGAQIEPWLASQVEAEQSGRRYRIRLRDGVRFHNGRRLTARDVRFTFERTLLNAQSEFRLLLAVIRGGQAMVDARTTELEGFRIRSALEFTVELEKPCPFFPALLSHLGLSILPEGVDFAATSWRDGLAGTGAFRVAHHEPGVRMELERNPGYWRDGYPRCERLIFETVANEEEAYSGFMKGAYSLLDNVAPRTYEELRRNPVYAGAYRETPVLATTLLALNAKSGPMENVGLRRALCRAIRVQDLVRVGSTPRVTAGTLIPPGLLGHDPNPVGSFGGSTGRDEPTGGVELRFAHPISPVHLATVSILKGMLEPAGFRLKPVVKSGDDFIQRIDEGAVDLGMVGWNLDYPDSHAMIHGMFDSREGVVRNLCGSPEMDKLIEEAQVEENSGVRQRLYRRIEEKIAEDALVLPLFYTQLYAFFRPELEGTSVHMVAPHVHYENLRLGG